jgi:4-hydroxybenzoate polyprenyltransferase
LWLAAQSWPDWQLVIIFSLGVVITRSAGCVINDLADRRLDCHVSRTAQRPLATGVIRVKEALLAVLILGLMALALVLLTNGLTVLLAAIAAVIIIIYPFMKRYTHWPQAILGVAWSWAVLMAFSAQASQLTLAAWLLFFAVWLWTLMFDTQYAMVDRTEDIKTGIKSTAVLLGDYDRLAIAGLQLITLLTLILLGLTSQLDRYYWLALTIISGLFGYQSYLIKDRQAQRCFKAFLNNHWVGLTLFLGITLSLSR